MTKYTTEEMVEIAETAGRLWADFNAMHDAVSVNAAGSEVKLVARMERISQIDLDAMQAYMDDLEAKKDKAERAMSGVTVTLNTIPADDRAAVIAAEKSARESGMSAETRAALAPWFATA